MESARPSADRWARVSRRRRREEEEEEVQPRVGGEVLSGEELSDGGGRIRRRAERRRAKRKRQKERKKLEKEEKSGDAEQEGGRSSSNQPSPLSGPQRRSRSGMSAAGAFVANAASHIRHKARNQSRPRLSRENKENEAGTSEVESSDPLKRKGASLTEKGIQLFKQGQLLSGCGTCSLRLSTVTPKDHRFFGNRSYCYWCLEFTPLHYQMLRSPSSSLLTGQRDTSAKGSALMGLKRYGEAERAMQQVLKLDQDCEEASTELFNCKVLQLMDLGFEEGQSVLLLEKFTTVQAALGPPEAARVVDLSSPQDSTGSPCPSLWVGNVTVDLTEKHIWDLFKTCGEIESIRVLHERFCAFVNFKNANMAALALERLQGVELESTRLVIRYPDHWMQRTPPSPQRTNPRGLNTSSASQYASTGPRRMAPINGDECFFWRTTGCLYGDKCHFKHKPDQRGRDRKPWQP
ncbi:hypothetical protein J4Q44_G00289680 [Coregonus suidteri]|uniref:Uncharacterized protein n=1 Tax=Coregonus suidteri TaxID=861788 RepID=A0AAN8L422_9TELE